MLGGEMMLTGKELKLKRIEKDIKAIEIAEQLGIHKSYVFLNGKRIKTNS